MIGVYGKYRGYGDYAGDLTKVPCVKPEDHVAAKQIFPLLMHDNWRSPTIKHHCPRTAVASSLRAMSNKVLPNPSILKEFSDWFRKVYIPEFIQYVDQESWIVEMEDWLTKYPLNYRAKIRKAYEYENRKDSCCELEAFAKIELQITTVPHLLKNTRLNTVKERQICGPQDMQKAIANAFVNILEKIANKYQEEYSGNKNWIEICDHLDKCRNTNPHFIYQESDQSGFDMTQLRPQQKLMNELKIAVLNHRNIELKYPLNVEDIEDVFYGSETLHVSVDHGQFHYDADGRASGHGWTTFDNTQLNIAYNKFVYYKAGIKEYFLKCKGDDTLNGHSRIDNVEYMKAHSAIFVRTAESQIQGLGQIIKSTSQGELTDLSFLSNHFFMTREGKLRMARIPHRVIQTLSWTTKLPDLMGDKLADARRQLCYSKGLCLLAWGTGLPIWQVLGEKMVQLGCPGPLTTFDQYADADRIWHKRDDSEAYMEYLEERYGVTETDVRDFEEIIRNITDLSGFIHCKMLEKFYD